MAAEAVRVAARIELALARHANPERCAVMSGGYSPSGLVYLGVPVPSIHRVVRELSRELQEARPREIINIALALVKCRTCEGRHAGWELIARRPDARALLTTRLIESLGRGNDNWA